MTGAQGEDAFDRPRLAIGVPAARPAGGGIGLEHAAVNRQFARSRRKSCVAELQLVPSPDLDMDVVFHETRTFLPADHHANLLAEHLRVVGDIPPIRILGLYQSTTGGAHVIGIVAIDARSCESPVDPFKLPRGNQIVPYVLPSFVQYFLGPRGNDAINLSLLVFDLLLLTIAVADFGWRRQFRFVPTRHDLKIVDRLRALEDTCQRVVVVGANRIVLVVMTAGATER